MAEKFVQKVKNRDIVAHSMAAEEKRLTAIQEEAHKNKGSKRAKVRARQAKAAREDAADVERCVHFYGRLTALFDKQGNYVGPKNNDQSPAAVAVRERICKYKAFADEKRDCLHRIQKKAAKESQSPQTAAEKMMKKATGQLIPE